MKNSFINIIKACVVACLITGLGIFLGALLLWKMDFGEGTLKAIVISLYVLSTVIGGFYIGKKQKEKKFLWGMATGTFYFIILIIVTLVFSGLSIKIGVPLITAGLACVMSGTLGGMLA